MSTKSFGRRKASSTRERTFLPSSRWALIASILSPADCGWSVPMRHPRTRKAESRIEFCASWRPDRTSSTAFCSQERSSTPRISQAIVSNPCALPVLVSGWLQELNYSVPYNLRWRSPAETVSQAIATACSRDGTFRALVLRRFAIFLAGRFTGRPLRMAHPDHLGGAAGPYDSSFWFSRHRHEHRRRLRSRLNAGSATSSAGLKGLYISKRRCSASLRCSTRPQAYHRRDDIRSPKAGRNPPSTASGQR